MKPDEQSRADLAEIKIKPILNGWILKTKKGWEAFHDIEVLADVVREEAVQARNNLVAATAKR